MIYKPQNKPFAGRMAFPIDSPDVGVQILQFPDVIRARVAATQIAPGVFQADLIAPADQGDYAILWDTDGDLWRWEDLTVTGSIHIPGGGGPSTPVPGAPRLLASVAQLEARLNVKGGDVETELLEELLEAASERVRDLTGRQFLPTPASLGDDPVVRTVSAFRSRICQARDLRNLEGISADGVDVTGQVRLISIDDHPAHLIRLPRPADQVTITGWFGFATVPPSIRDAVLGWAQRAYHETRARMGDSVVDPDGGVQTYFRSVPTFVSGPASSFRIDGL